MSFRNDFEGMARSVHLCTYMCAATGISNLALRGSRKLCSG